jgi:hypothetical protein
MNVTDALQTWARNEMEVTLGFLNQVLTEKGEPRHNLSTEPIVIKFNVAPVALCNKPDCQGEQCLDCHPARPVLQLSAITDLGQKLSNEKHAAEFTMEEFFTSVVQSAQGQITV